MREPELYRKGGLALFMGELIEWYKEVANNLMKTGLRKYSEQNSLYNLVLNMKMDFSFKENEEARDCAMKICRYNHMMAAQMAGKQEMKNSKNFIGKYYLLKLKIIKLIVDFCIWKKQNSI